MQTLNLTRRAVALAKAERPIPKWLFHAHARNRAEDP